MTPKVQVPMDFGIEYLGSSSHGNLKFMLKDGEELYANSAIMSFNSPVIKKMTIEGGLTAADARNFSKDALQCFLNASYSGALKNLTKLTFREINAMAHVFDVSWIIEKCFDYFKWLTEIVEEKDFQDQVYIYDEAMFILNNLKKKCCVDIVIQKFTSMANCVKNFANYYFSDLSSCKMELGSLDVLLQMTDEQERILMEILVNNIENDNSSLSHNSRYILHRLNIPACRAINEPLYQRLLDMIEGIENPSAEDFRVMMKILRQPSVQTVQPVEQAEQLAVQTVIPAVHKNKEVPVRRSTSNVEVLKLPNLFYGYRQLKAIQDLDSLASLLVNSPLVSNSYIFYDAVYCWLYDKRIDNETPFLHITDSFVELFSNQMTRKGWKPLAHRYIKDKTYMYLGGLTEKILEKPTLVTEEQYSRIRSTATYSPNELFARNHDIKFKFKPDSVAGCNQPGDCGFILRVTAAAGKQGESFNLQLVIDTNLYPDDIHFHRESMLLADCIHVALDITDDDNVFWSSRPVTWHGKPCVGQGGASAQRWSWGPRRFYKKGKEVKSAETVGGYKRSWYTGSNTKIRPVVYCFTEKNG